MIIKDIKISWYSGDLTLDVEVKMKEGLDEVFYSIPCVDYFLVNKFFYKGREIKNYKDELINLFEEKINNNLNPESKGYNNYNEFFENVLKPIDLTSDRLLANGLNIKCTKCGCWVSKHIEKYLKCPDCRKTK